MFFVFNLCLCKRCLARNAPIDGFFAPHKTTTQGKFAELPDDRCLVRKIHCEIRVFPLSKDTEALKFVALYIDVFFGVLTAISPYFHLGHFQLPFTQFRVHPMLNGKTVAIPSRHIGCVKACHLF